MVKLPYYNHHIHYCPECGHEWECDDTRPCRETGPQLCINCIEKEENMKMNDDTARGIMRTKGFDLARQLAEERHCAYGLGVTDGMYYIGPITELDKLPVVIKGSYEEEDNG